ncbi:hypothetical protein C7379_11038 [Hallella colorans]|uniref:Uncharacterized protein n=1 Tax=Hallella colorans TaxID=1703337 RepID=A0A2U0U7K9_9BACT|nr:hypothetical protein C7379_11038 [Hallella colorans]
MEQTTCLANRMSKLIKHSQFLHMCCLVTKKQL